jgi:hypothetical protein
MTGTLLHLSHIRHLTPIEGHVLLSLERNKSIVWDL